MSLEDSFKQTCAYYRLFLLKVISAINYSGGSHPQKASSSALIYMTIEKYNRLLSRARDMVAKIRIELWISELKFFFFAVDAYQLN